MSDDRVVAAYLIETPHALEHAAEVIAGEQSSGTFVSVPGETIELRFILFDEGDHRFDSTVLIDAIQFELDAAAAPVTIG